MAMIRINGLTEGLEYFKALGSDVRMSIIELLSKNKSMSMNELALALGLTNGALTPHIRMLEQTSIIHVEARHTGHGIQKICTLSTDHILLNMQPQVEKEDTKVYDAEIRVGHYFNYSVGAPCGLSGKDALLGPENDPRVFSSPERMDAQMLWFHNGSIEYRIPNMLPEKQRIVQLTISLEISSADQALEDETPADISFYLNDGLLCTWRSYTGSIKKGIYTPSWWTHSQRRHGYLKMLVINGAGIYIDGVKAAGREGNDPFLDENQEMRFRIETHPSPDCHGGVAIYGSGFGNYNQNIQAIVHYMPEEVIAKMEAQLETPQVRTGAGS